MHAAGIPLQASIGAEIHERRFAKTGETLFANDQNHVAPAGGFLHVKRATLREVSILAFAADSTSSVTIAAALKGRTEMSTTEVHEETTEQPDATQTERLRAAACIRAAAGHADIAAKAVELGWDETKTEVTVLRAERAHAPMIRSGGRVADGDVLCAGLCLNAGLSESFLSEQFTPQVMNQATSLEARGTTIHTILRAVARSAGNPLPEGKLTASDVRQAFEASLQLRASGFSTISLPGVLGNTVGRILLESYRMPDSVARKISKASSLSDFKVGATSYRLSSIGSLEKLPPGGEIKHGSLGEDSFTSKLETYAKMLTIDRQTIINDDLDAMASIPRLFGRMAALSLELATFELLLSNPSNFFSAGNLNYVEGATTNLSLESLGALMQKFADQVDADGKPVLLVPRYLVVPTSLAAVAKQLVSSLELVGSTTADALKPAGNPFVGSLEVLTSPYLNNTSIPGSSAVAWYLFGSPNDLAAISISYLDGKQSPTIETAEVDFHQLGISLRCYHDWGVSMEDHRAAAKSKGSV